MFGKNKDQVDFELFSIYDSKTQAYGNPTHAVNHHDLIRQVTNMFLDPSQRNNQLFTNAEDFSVFRIGTYSKSTGTISAINPEHIANLHDLRALVRAQEPKNIQTGIGPT